MNTPEAVVVDPSGRIEPLGDFLARMIKVGGRPVSEVARRAHLSRSFLYLLLDDRQVPSVDSLVSLLEAAGAEGVRPSGPGSPGDIEFDWSDERRWVRLPDLGRRSARSKSALRTLSSARRAEPGAGTEDLWVEGVLGGAGQAGPAPPRVAAAAAGVAPMMAPPAGPDRAAGTGSDARDRTQLLGDLLHAAAELDEDRLRLLIDHANLLRRSR